MTTEKAPRAYWDDIEGVLRHYGRRVRVVQLWRQSDNQRNAWIYLERVDPQERYFFKFDSFLELLKTRFRGGWYRAKFLGEWDRQKKREQSFGQVSFGIHGPPTATTVSIVKRSTSIRTLEARPPVNA